MGVRSKRRSTVSFRVQTAKVELTPGPIGVTFSKGTPPEIISVAADSPLADRLSIGQVIEKVIIPDIIESECCSGEDLEHLLAESLDTEGRILLIKTDDSKYDPKGRCSKVYIPKGEDFGIQYEGDIPIVRKVGKDSPLAHRLNRGQLVYQFTRVHTSNGETQVINIMSTKSLKNVLKVTSGKRVRALLVQNIDIKAYRKAIRRKNVMIAISLLILVGSLIYVQTRRKVTTMPV